MDNTSIYVAIDFDKNGSPLTVTSHDSLERAKGALHMRLQCYADEHVIEWKPIYDFDNLIDRYIPEEKSQYRNQAVIYKTVLNNRY